MPSLKEGIEYVGVIQPINKDIDFLLTDMDGVIDSLTSNVTNVLGLAPNMFKDKESQINI